jgi:hypothetical protein
MCVNAVASKRRFMCIMSNPSQTTRNCASIRPTAKYFAQNATTPGIMEKPRELLGNLTG